MEIKPGQLASSLGWQTLELVFSHPAQQKNHALVESLIARLRACDESADYYDFQKHLFQAVYKADVRRGQCTRALLRLKKGKPADAPAPAEGLTNNEIDAWRLEEYVYERIARQLRSVGDALAWRSFGYDRRLILTLSRNSPVGSMNMKSGLDYELGRVEDIWKESGHFALLHDLTNSIRMGDVTEFTADGGVLFHEVKTNPNNKDKAQIRRIQKAIDAIMNDGRLPGHQEDAKLMELKTAYKTDLKQLKDLLGLARKDGFKGMKLREGRALTAFDLRRAFELYHDKPQEATQKHAAVRLAATKRAGIDKAIHHVNGISTDTAARSPIIAPWAIYPFSVADCAALTCDLLRFETILSVDALAKSLKDLGLRVSIKLPEQSSTQMPDEQHVLRAEWQDRGLTLHGGGMNTLLYELLTPHVWASGMYEVLTDKDPPQSPVIIFANEHSTWWQ